MLPKPHKISTEALSKHASYFTIGFARLNQNNGSEDAVSAGSGTLVTVGSLHGILTAAHVTESLPKDGDVGLILSVEGREQYQKLVMKMGHTEPPVVMRAQQFGPLGPDLAFLRLTDEACGWLKAQCSFHSLSKRRGGKFPYTGPVNLSTDSITGTIHELTKEVDSDRRGVRRVNFYAIFSPVRISAMQYPDAHDLIYVQMATEHEPTFKVPGSFEGTSGGGVWILHSGKGRQVRTC